jgi:hypothetical protein
MRRYAGQVHLGACFQVKPMVYAWLDTLRAACPKHSRVLLSRVEEAW